LKEINIQPLVERITHLIEIFGGVNYAFDMEWKIRLFVVEVLNFCLLGNNLNTDKLKKNSAIKFKNFNEHSGLKIDGEKGLEQFAARVQPDLTVLTYDNLKTLYQVEIKNLRCNKGRAIIKQAVYENFKQLRHYCLLKKKDEMSGIASNFGVWHLTHYIKKEEMLGRPAF
jgi:hypothetical protein